MDRCEFPIGNKSRTHLAKLGKKVKLGKNWESRSYWVQIGKVGQMGCQLEKKIKLDPN